MTTSGEHILLLLWLRAVRSADDPPRTYPHIDQPSLHALALLGTAVLKYCGPAAGTAILHRKRPAIISDSDVASIFGHLTVNRWPENKHEFFNCTGITGTGTLLSRLLEDAASARMQVINAHEEDDPSTDEDVLYALWLLRAVADGYLKPPPAGRTPQPHHWIPSLVKDMDIKQQLPDSATLLQTIAPLYGAKPGTQSLIPFKYLLDLCVRRAGLVAREGWCREAYVAAVEYITLTLQDHEPSSIAAIEKFVHLLSMHESLYYKVSEVMYAVDLMPSFLVVGDGLDGARMEYLFNSKLINSFWAMRTKIAQQHAWRGWWGAAFHYALYVYTRAYPQAEPKAFTLMHVRRACARVFVHTRSTLIHTTMCIQGGLLDDSSHHVNTAMHMMKCEDDCMLHNTPCFGSLFSLFSTALLM